MRGRTWIVAALIVVGLAVLAIALRSDTSDEQASASDSDSEPAQVEPIEGTDLSRVILSADAAKRLGIRTAPVARRGAQRKVIPYAAVIYGADGHTFTYTSPERLVFVRRPISVDYIARGRAFLASGPPAGTAVVTVGSQELFGTEYEVEED